MTVGCSSNGIIAPRILIAERILRFVRAGGHSRITPIEHGRAEVIELDVAAESPIVGRPLAEVAFPRGAIIGAVIRQENIFIPGGADVIEPDDILIVFALTQARRQVEALVG